MKTILKIILMVAAIMVVTSINSFAATMDGHKINLKEENISKVENILPINNAKLQAGTMLSLDMPKIGNQGYQGSCASWATGYYLRGHQKNKLFSPSYIYNQVNGGVDNGSSLYNNFEILVNQGICEWSYMPYKASDFITQPSTAAKTNAAKYKAASWGVIGDTSGNIYVNNPDSIKAWLVQVKDPVVVGVPVDKTDFSVGVNKIKYSAKKTTGFISDRIYKLTGCKTQARIKNSKGKILSQNKTYETKENKVYLKVYKGKKYKSAIKTLKAGTNTFYLTLKIGSKSAQYKFVFTKAENNIYDKYSKANDIGGHAICICGYDDKKKAFKFANSWGTEYGFKGYGWLSYALIASGFSGEREQYGFVCQ